MARFVQLFNEVMSFQTHSPDKQILHSNDGSTFVSYLADIFQKLNLLNNKELQGNNSTLLTCKTNIIRFIAKLEFYRLQVKAANFEQFPNVAMCVPISHAATDVL